MVGEASGQGDGGLMQLVDKWAGQCWLKLGINFDLCMKLEPYPQPCSDLYTTRFENYALFIYTIPFAGPVLGQ